MLVSCTDGVLEYNAEIDMQKTITCGQTFRWHGGNGVFCGVAGWGENERRITVSQSEDGNLTVCAAKSEFEAFWQEYFDLQTDYGALARFAEDDPFFAACHEYGRGIRVLRQDLWETVVTFILSQRSSIPRIEGCVRNLVEIFGHFPGQEELLSASPDALAAVRCGYRAPYLADAAAFSGYAGLAGADYGQAKACLKQIKGVGDKVADCIILFGLHNRNAFPVDVWLERVLARKYPRERERADYGKMSGIVQQYMFYYAINNKHEFR